MVLRWPRIAESRLSWNHLVNVHDACKLTTNIYIYMQFAMDTKRVLSVEEGARPMVEVGRTGEKTLLGGLMKRGRWLKGGSEALLAAMDEGGGDEIELEEEMTRLLL